MRSGRSFQGREGGLVGASGVNVTGTGSLGDVSYYGMTATWEAGT